MATAQDVLQVAIGELGTVESPANSNKTKYGAWYGMDGQPWCAMFVSWCFANAGMPLTIETDHGFAYCPSGRNWFAQRGALARQRFARQQPTIGLRARVGVAAAPRRHLQGANEYENHHCLQHSCFHSCSP